MNPKKLQVFISSTYEDLKEERQAAVEAILQCGHIPAGMELFSAGDKSQMEVIRRWIEESDVFLLILGGRYGSIEPKTSNSYIHLEYEYASTLNKPLFAIVIEDSALDNKIKEQGKLVIEQENPQKLKDFKQLVLSKLVKYYKDIKDIKLAIHETMSEYSRREDLIGWVRSNCTIDTGNLAEELSRLSKENAQLREQISKVVSNKTILGVNIDKLITLLKEKKIAIDIFDKEYGIPIENTKNFFNEENANLFHLVWTFKDDFSKNGFLISIMNDREDFWLKAGLQELFWLGIIEYRGTRNYNNYYKFTEEGRKLYLNLITERF